jgi:hypothetical protein
MLLLMMNVAVNHYGAVNNIAVNNYNAVNHECLLISNVAVDT